jgi:hypothetical protein
LLAATGRVFGEKCIVVGLSRVSVGIDSEEKEVNKTINEK